jgi:hypothetical protein
MPNMDSSGEPNEKYPASLDAVSWLRFPVGDETVEPWIGRHLLHMRTVEVDKIEIEVLPFWRTFERWRDSETESWADAETAATTRVAAVSRAERVTSATLS